MKSLEFGRWSRFMVALGGVGLALVLAVQWGSERMRVFQVDRELHNLAWAIEEYCKQHGGYPKVGDQTTLFAMLMQKRNTPGLKNPHQRWIEPGAFFYANPDPEASGNYLLDPWGRAYRYLYRSAADGQAESYVLFSVGSDGLSSDPTAWGSVGRGRTPVDIDNFYAQ